jgi:hypothetical protein
VAGVPLNPPALPIAVGSAGWSGRSFDGLETSMEPPELGGVAAGLSEGVPSSGGSM